MKTLIDKYLAGETTLTEEQTLRSYFKTESDIPADLQWAKALFGGFDAILREDGIEGQAGNSATKKRHTLRPLYSWLSVAAVVTIAMMVTLTTKSSETVYCYVNGQPVTELAVAERQAELISRIAGSGQRVAMAGAEIISENVSHTAEIDKAMKYLDLIKN